MDHLIPSVVTAAATIQPKKRHVSQIFNFKDFAMFCGTFLKLSTLKNLLCLPKISSLYKVIGMFARLSTFFSFLGDLWFIVRVRIRVRVRV